MNCITRVSSSFSCHTAAAILGRGTNSVRRSVWQHHHSYSSPFWNNTNFSSLSFGFKSINLEFVLKFSSDNIGVHCYSTSSASKSSGKVSRKKKKSAEEKAMEKKEKEEGFFVVRKGDIVGVYKSFIDCKSQIGSSICDPPVSVYKGYSLPKDSEDYLLSQGLHNALYTIRAQDFKDGLFGTLVPLQLPASSRAEASSSDATRKRSQEFLGLETDGSTTGLTDPLRKQPKLDNQNDAQSSCVLEFDGASKGNPGRAGAGALLRTTDGRIICRLREGLGTVTCNVAEYRAIILGMKYALQKGFTKIRVQGDSKLVCSQVQGLWKVKHKDMANLYEQVKQLKDRFVSFQISHVLREFNSEADAQANLAIKLADGQVQEVCE